MGHTKHRDAITFLQEQNIYHTTSLNLPILLSYVMNCKALDILS